ncbi:MAG: response regulator transcription factor, partial [Desulfofustis sp.]|nr:response regulator transcription factor [Desulfofustis sp.]
LLDWLRKNAVDLLILDISMPKASGIELTEILKKRYPNLKILVLTMHKNIRFLRRAIAAGADGYLVKSDTEQEIISAIGKIREGGTYISPCLENDFAEEMLNTYRNPSSSRTFKGLTKREKQVLELVVDGMTSKQIAADLGLSPRTVDHHRASLLKKFDMNNSVDLVNFAIKNGYVTIEE